MIPDMDIIYTDEKGVVELPSLTYAIEYAGLIKCEWEGSFRKLNTGREVTQ